jgi:hypothetical protein
MPTATQVCACKACKCEVEPNKAVKQDGQAYCSEPCAQGHKNHKGCGHLGCPC